MTRIQSALRFTTGVPLLTAGMVLALALQSFTPTDSAAALQEQKQEKRVYTNDDFPFNESRAESPPSSDSGAPAASSSGGEKVAPFVPTPMEVVDKMLEVAGTTSKDVVYDLGSGDGRIVLRAAQTYSAKAVGVELDHGLAVESADKAKEMKLDKLVTIIEGDLFKTDLKPATVVTVYLLLDANDRLRPILERDLRPGTRVVAHDIRIPGWEASREESLSIGGGTHTIYLYEIPSAFRTPAPR